MRGRKEDFRKIIQFIKEAEQLKDTLRSAFTSKRREESTAEHTWRLCLLSLMLEDSFQEYDFKRVLELCLVHDLGELYDGDVPAIDKAASEVKLKNEQLAIDKLAAFLPETQGVKLRELFMEYEYMSSKEAKLVKALDKIETIIQHNQGDNPDNFDYQFNLDYGKQYCVHDERLQELREIVDSDTIFNVRMKQSSEV